MASLRQRRRLVEMLRRLRAHREWIRPLTDEELATSTDPLLWFGGEVVIDTFTVETRSN